MKTPFRTTPQTTRPQTTRPQTTRPQPVGQQAAQLLLSDKMRGTLSAFIEPLPLSTAAARLGLPLNTVKYRLKRLLAAGLLKAIPGTRLYQAEATPLFIAYDQLPAHWARAALTLLHQPWEERLSSALVRQAEATLRERQLWGVQVVLTQGELVLEHAVHHADWNFTHRDAPALLDLLDELKLDYQEAKAFQQEVLELLQRYQQKGGAQPYLLRLALVPEGA